MAGLGGLGFGSGLLFRESRSRGSSHLGLQPLTILKTCLFTAVGLQSLQMAVQSQKTAGTQPQPLCQELAPVGVELTFSKPRP